MTVRWVGLLLYVVVLLSKPVIAQDAAAVEPVTFNFLTTPEISIKLKAPNLGRPVRGKLLSLTDGEVIVDTGTLSRRDRERGERGQRVPFSRIETLRSSDGRFEFSPENEDFRTIAQKAVDTYPSIRVEGSVASLEMARPPRTGKGKKNKDDDDEPGPIALPGADEPKSDPSEKMPPSSGKPKGIGNGGFGGMNKIKKNKKDDDESETDQNATPSESDVAADSSPSLPGAGEVLICSNCSKEIPASAASTGVCPHCKATFLNTTSSPASSGADPFAKTGGSTNTGANAFAASGSPPPAAAAPAAAGQPASNTVVVQGNGGFSFDQVPNWAKGGIFVLLVLVGWQLLFNR